MYKLAIFDGKPLFADELCVNRPTIGNRSTFLNRVEKMLDSRMFTNSGPLVRELESKLAEYLGVKHCIATCNGTMALQLIMKALNLTGEVIVPSFTFIATAHAVSWQGLKPIFCDVDIDTNNIDPVACERLINKNTTAILGVHLWGRACDIEKLQSLADKYNIKLIFDSAHAFGCSHKNKMIAGFGDAEAFSFHSTKAFHTFEGGAVTTNNSEIAQKIKRLRNFGFVDYDCVDGIGINGKMPEVCAAMGLTNLESFSSSLTNNKKIYDEYKKLIAGLKGLSLHTYDETEKNNYQYVVIDVDESAVGLSRDNFIEILHAENIKARKYFYPGCHNMQPYISNNDTNKLNLLNTRFLSHRLMVLPAGSSMTIAQVNKVGNILKSIIGQSKLIKSKLEALN
ncbi:MAG: aminotransferase class I/II-fold pyridoxal phosphate-dependent enzyme [Alcanivoracaceae bacterium]|nr:aminotransferase class I/II-fold pyridoxal phosphate-dependent enzyme [Alcanivoracaceae bacterium]